MNSSFRFRARKSEALGPEDFRCGVRCNPRARKRRDAGLKPSRISSVERPASKQNRRQPNAPRHIFSRPNATRRRSDAQTLPCSLHKSRFRLKSRSESSVGVRRTPWEVACVAARAHKDLRLEFDACAPRRPQQRESAPRPPRRLFKPSGRNFQRQCRKS